MNAQPCEHCNVSAESFQSRQHMQNCVRSVKPSSRDGMGGGRNQKSPHCPGAAFPGVHHTELAKQPQLCLSSAPLPQQGQGQPGSLCTRGAAVREPERLEPQGAQPGPAQDTPWPCDSQGTVVAQGAPAPWANPSGSQSITLVWAVLGQPLPEPCWDHQGTQTQLNTWTRCSQRFLQPKPLSDLPELC